MGATNRDSLHHLEVNDAQVELRIHDRSKRLEHLILSQRHAILRVSGFPGSENLNEDAARICTTSIGRIPGVDGYPQQPHPAGSDATPLTDSEFSAAVVAVTTAFGDPTRRQIYLFAREHD